MLVLIPDIDKFINKLNYALDYISSYKKSEDINELYDMINECESALVDAIDDFETIRDDNRNLRDWGF